MSVMPYLKLLRVKQWIKNLLLLVPLIFAQKFFDSVSLVNAVAALALFCLLSSSVYIFNDLHDLEDDKRHPVKKNRPLSSGSARPTIALALAILLSLTALLGACYLNQWLGFIFAIYLTMNFLYSYYLKTVVIIDVMVLALNYVLRVLAGTVVIHAAITHWLLVMIIFLSLFLGFGKRRHELTVLGEEATLHRLSLKEYNPYFLDQLIGVVTASTVGMYSLYTLNEEVVQRFGTSYLTLTIPFVLYGVFRYLYLIHQRQVGGNPAETILLDRPLLVDIILWFVAVVVIIYF